MTPFRLAALLRLRKVQQDQAAGELAKAAGARLRASEQATHQRQALGSHRTPPTCSSTAWTASVAARAALTTAAIDAADTVRRSSEAVDEATIVWQETRRRTTALEHLEERHAEAVVREQRRNEQLRLDEHTSATGGRHPEGERP